MSKELKPNAKKNTKIVLEYLEKFPNAPSKTLARKIYEENKGFFNTFEHVYIRVDITEVKLATLIERT